MWLTQAGWPPPIAFQIQKFWLPQDFSTTTGKGHQTGRIATHNIGVNRKRASSKQITEAFLSSRKVSTIKSRVWRESLTLARSRPLERRIR
eukprot:scaffold244_cov172-Amphora_coffeaeformis.AAC.7